MTTEPYETRLQPEQRNRTSDEFRVPDRSVEFLENHCMNPSRVIQEAESQYWLEVGAQQSGHSDWVEGAEMTRPTKVRLAKSSPNILGPRGHNTTVYSASILRKDFCWVHQKRTTPVGSRLLN